MMPRRLVERRKQSRPARHTEAAPFACVGELKLQFGAQVAGVFCTGCGKVIELRAIIPNPPEPQLKSGWRDEESDVDDPEAYGV